jgi:membrane protein YqaA with SNARE-associated domain
MSLAVAFLWAVAEATVWPIMPDAALVPMALARPGSWWRLVVAAALGTTVGGVVSYRLGRSRPVRSDVERLAMVRPAMVGAVERWLEAEGPRGVWRQPATGVPFKVFARVAGARRLPVVPFLAWAVAARGVRFFVLTGLAALVGGRWPAVVARWYWLLSGVWAAVFGLTLWRLVRFWEHRPETDGPEHLQNRG